MAVVVGAMLRSSRSGIRRLGLRATLLAALALSVIAATPLIAGASPSGEPAVQAAKKSSKVACWDHETKAASVPLKFRTAPLNANRTVIIWRSLVPSGHAAHGLWLFQPVASRPATSCLWP